MLGYDGVLLLIGCFCEDVWVVVLSLILVM